MAAVSENAPRLSFNPSWMGSTFGSTVPSSVSRSVSMDDSGPDTGGQGKNYPLAPPKLAKNRYGREEMLALFQPDYDWPSLHVLKDRFPEFYMDECGQPITVSSFTEVEERYLQQGINSSKAMSALTHAEKNPGGGSGFHNTRWQPEDRAAGFDSGAPAGRGSGFGSRGRGGYAGSSSFPYRGRGGGVGGLSAPGGGNGSVSSENGRFGSGPGGIGRGRGAGTPTSPGGPARGGGNFPAINPRAQGLYDPRDPRDRPRQRLRSTGEGGSSTGAYQAPGARAWNRGDDVPEWAAEDDAEEEAGWSFGEDGQFRKDKLPSEEPPLKGNATVIERPSREADKSAKETNGERKSTSKERAKIQREAEDGKENSWSLDGGSSLGGDPRRGTTPSTDSKAKPGSVLQQVASSQLPSSQNSDASIMQTSMVPGGASPMAPFAGSGGGAMDNRKRLSELLKGATTAATGGGSKAHSPMMSNLSASLGSQPSGGPSRTQGPEQAFEKIHSDVETLVNSFSESDSVAIAMGKLAGLGGVGSRSESSFYDQQHRRQPAAGGAAGVATGRGSSSSATSITGPPTHPSATSQSSSTSSPSNPWYYLDPHHQVQGPFNASQMTAWFQAGYFDMGLKVRRQSDREFVFLADLIKVYGGIPFSMEIGAGAPGPATPSQPHAPSPQQMLPSHPQSQFSASTTQAKLKTAAPPQSVWGDVDPAPAPNDAQIALEKLAQIQKQQMQEKQRLEAEQRRIQELEAQYKKEKEEREKQEREFLEQQQELKRIQVELQKQRQKEEMEQKRKEETERRQREALELEQKRRDEAVRKEAEERERQAREEIERQIREEQQRVREKEQKKLQEQAEKAAAATAEAMRKAEVEQRIAEEKERAERAERERRELSTGHRISINDLLRLSGQPGGGWGSYPNENQPSVPADQGSGSAWNRPTAAAPAPAAATPPNAKSLLEIQREEERQAKAEMRQRAELEKERKSALQNMNMGSDSVWGGGKAPLHWNPPAGAAAAPAWGGAGVPAASQGFWDTDPSPIARPTPQDNRSKATKKHTSQSNSSHKGGNPQNQQQTKGKAKKKNNPLGGAGSSEDPVVQWMIKEIESLNSDVDAPTFANFILAVESPIEVEEFVTGYFGESKPAKEFLQTFLRKRSEQRNSRKKTSDRDDLSAPAAALGTAGGAAAAPGTVAGLGKKKKKGQRKVVDSRVLGFTAAADSTRLNIGEIEVPE